MLRNVLTVGGWTMASRLLGFVRDMLIAAMLGTGPVADAFFVALRLPNLFRRLFGEGAFNAAFVPAFSGMLAAEGRPPARQLRRGDLRRDGVLARRADHRRRDLHAAGDGRAGARLRGEYPGKFALAVTLSRITFPYLLLICLAALVSGVLNGLDRFTAASASYVLFNIVSIAFMLWLTPYVPTAGHALAWGVTVVRRGAAWAAAMGGAARRHAAAPAAPAPDAAGAAAAAAHGARAWWAPA